MPDAIAELGRIGLSAFLALYCIVTASIWMVNPRHLQPLIISILAAFASAVTLFHVVVVRLPGWPAMSMAVFVLALLVGTARYAHITYGRRAGDHG